MKSTNDKWKRENWRLTTTVKCKVLLLSMPLPHTPRAILIHPHWVDSVFVCEKTEDSYCSTCRGWLSSIQHPREHRLPSAQLIRRLPETMRHRPTWTLQRGKEGEGEGRDADVVIREREVSWRRAHLTQSQPVVYIILYIVSFYVTLYKIHMYRHTGKLMQV